ncbi:MAG: SWIM zinc finger family protein [Candidatus Nanoarchaeia archaeon]|nr:SWIM zinc finger domain-containing protein [Candidatus Haiyanarchaeum thermophilum]MCW1302882.1 SWIM zinc finger domain-containing protein [Candidatus Haiyanarchaeum thermophilum]MCW1303561.1 SWIM zinc finger domain-containing protein [Candidatus Haiyanarchaeum thermophilum]MCW1306243.1 SWIM zinc finger domain-containing protein [Candidatus Haiyanarchaeum thermophilum]MCW1307521.1 SWIM zinc finger domain-containing protein [Candidatus Haiyanarchaeum thermophilum]
MKILSKSEIFSRQYRRSARRAKYLAQNVFLDYVTSRHASFIVVDDLKGRRHIVLYRSDKPIKWSCDCKWYSTKLRFCAHILAVNLRLNLDDELRMKIEKNLKE